MNQQIQGQSSEGIKRTQYEQGVGGTKPVDRFVFADNTKGLKKRAYIY